MQAPDELTERQVSLIAQVGAGEITEQQPDTEEQLLGLVRLGHLDATHDAEGWHFTPAAKDDATNGAEQTPPPTEPTPPPTEPTPPPPADASPDELHRLLADLERFGHVEPATDGHGFHFTPHAEPTEPATPADQTQEP